MKGETIASPIAYSLAFFDVTTKLSVPDTEELAVVTFSHPAAPREKLWSQAV